MEEGGTAAAGLVRCRVANASTTSRGEDSHLQCESSLLLHPCPALCTALQTECRGASKERYAMGRLPLTWLYKRPQ